MFKTEQATFSHPVSDSQSAKMAMLLVPLQSERSPLLKTHMTLIARDVLKKFNCCDEGIEWAGDRTAEEAWRECEQASWLYHFSLDVGVNRRRIIFALCQIVCEMMEVKPDSNVKRGIELAENWAAYLSDVAAFKAIHAKLDEDERLARRVSKRIKTPERKMTWRTLEAVLVIVEYILDINKDTIVVVMSSMELAFDDVDVFEKEAAEIFRKHVCWPDVSSKL